MNGSVSGSIELEADCFARDRILKPSLFSLQNRMFSLTIRGSSPWRGTGRESANDAGSRLFCWAEFRAGNGP